MTESRFETINQADTLDAADVEHWPQVCSSDRRPKVIAAPQTVVVRLPPAAGSLAIVRVRAVNRTGLPNFGPAQPYVVVWGIQRHLAAEIVVRRNTLAMQAGNVQQWHCLIECNGSGWGVVTIEAGNGWQPTSPTDFPPDAEIRKDAHSICKRRNKGVHMATVADVDWWIPVHRFDVSQAAQGRPAAEAAQTSPETPPVDVETKSDGITEPEGEEQAEAKPVYLHPSIVFEFPNDGKAALSSERSYVFMRGVTLATARAVVAEHNRTKMGTTRKGKNWLCIVRNNGKFTVIKVKVKADNANPYQWQPNTVWDFPASMQWRTSAQMKAIRTEILPADAETRRHCFQLFDVLKGE